jgi:tetratricopeptide (TPR) repeat protein
LVIALMVPGAVFGPRLIKRGWHSFTHPVTAQGSNTGRLLNLSGSRYLVWKSALKAFDQSPATGTGAGTFQFWWNRHGTTYEFAQDAHNIWLENLAELGAPGLLLIIGVAVGALATGIAVRRRARRRASVGASTAFLAAFVVYLMHASVDWMWESTAVTVLALAGIAAIGARLSVPAGRLGWASRVTLSLLATGAAVLQVPGIVSTIDIRNSQAAERAGNASLALARANDAVDAEPWAASAYEQRGLILESAGRLPQAADDLQRAISHERTNFTHWLVLARIETERGRLGAAVRDYQQARSLRPQAYVFEVAPYFKTR